MNLSEMPGIANIVKTRRSAGSLASTIYTVIFGVVFAAVGMLFINFTSVDDSWTRVQGTVVDVKVRSDSDGTTYAPIVTYTVNGQTYNKTSNSSSSARPSIGSAREIAYNPAVPSESQVVEETGTLLIMYIFPVVGALLAFIGIYSFVKARKRDKEIATLQARGQKLQGVLVEIRSSPNRKSNSYAIVVAAVDQTGKTQNYVSDWLSGIGAITLADFQNTPIPIDVYIDPTNAKNYYVDISDIPDLTPERIQALLTKAAAANVISAQAPGTPPIVPIAAPSQEAPIPTVPPVLPK